ncbi:MAG: peptide chain release factor N(5)-glutamine methyltransferase [Planctomycetia bacterium]|nr:MAG: peptide chain release factor N(5)-glutamine methyltransferase [Planctomycetia bacterium]
MEASGKSTTAWTVERLLGWTREHLTRRGIESPRLCAEILLADALRCERIQLYARHDSTPEPDALSRFREVVRRAGEGAPIAYLTGRKEFYSLAFEVNSDVLIPRPETELLVERVIHRARRGEGPIRDIVDVGTGSGCIAIALAKHLPEARLFASDVSGGALAVARRNADKHGVAERVRYREGALLNPWTPGRGSADGDAALPPVFDVIVSNPPYVATAARDLVARNVLDFEPHLALFAGADGLDVIRALIPAAVQRLRPGGRLLLEIGFDQAAAVRVLLTEGGWLGIETVRDSNRHERVIEAQRPGGGGAGASLSSD